MSDHHADGILNINKPIGVTSMEVVRRIKRILRVKRVGHGGTLDPLATGVIPVCIGRATRIMEYLIGGAKAYRGVVELGVTTDTYDSVGEVTGTGDISGVSRDAVDTAVAAFAGVIQQVPPMYSAQKKDGQRLYDLARKGIEVEREPRSVTVHGIDLTAYDPPLATIEVRCGRGFYMRSLAYDLGQTLGCGGHLKSLVRSRVGPFLLRDALSLETLEGRFGDGTWSDSLHATDVVLGDMRAVIAGDELTRLIQNGRPVPPNVRISASKPEERCRVYSVDGRFIAILSFDVKTHEWKPEKVFQPA